NLTSVTQAVYAGAAVGKMTNNSTLYDINVAADMQISVATVTGVTYAGGIVGQSEGVVSNVENHAAITASGGDVYAGGVAGQVYGTGLKLKKIWNYGTVNAISYGNEASAGGIVGYAPVSVNMGDDNTIILNAGAVSSSGGNRNYSGGIVGRASWTASFSEDTSNSGQVSISAPAASGSYAGGLAGSMDSLVVGRTHAFAFNNTGAVTNNGGTNVYTGGIAGYIEGALTWDDNLANNAGVSASGMSQVYSGGLFGS
ncbi:hypothetical protein K0U00_43135, partial [Paenibacillus sepulcri]|nr:hypothetical protein [Paenibacillus sepulcri]